MEKFLTVTGGFLLGVTAAFAANLAANWVFLWLRTRHMCDENNTEDEKTVESSEGLEITQNRSWEAEPKPRVHTKTTGWLN